MAIDFKKLYIKEYGQEAYDISQMRHRLHKELCKPVRGLRNKQPEIFQCYTKIIESKYYLQVDNGSTGYECTELSKLLQVKAIHWRACAGNTTYNECLLLMSDIKEYFGGLIDC